MFLTGTQDLKGFVLLNNAIGYMHNYPGVTHHPTEEIILTKLRALSPSETTSYDKISNQHIAFSHQETTMLLHIREAQAGDMIACKHLKTIGASYCTDHWEHITIEEKDMFPLALAVLRDKDWEEVLAKRVSVIDPIFQKDSLRYYESLYDYLMSSEMDLNIH